MFALSKLLSIICYIAFARAHTQITYPGERGDNLHTNGSLPQHNPEVLGIEYFQNGSLGFPYGMQWMYPCGGMPTSRNRTFWPYQGGAVSIQPGWFPGHVKAFFYVNMGINGPGQEAPPNMSHVLVPPFQILGPTNNEYDGQFCLPQVPMPVNVTLKPGDNVTLQVIEVAQHGAALYNCVDLTLVEPHDHRLKNVTPQNCYNSSDISFELVFTTAALTNSALNILARPSSAPLITAAFVMIAMALL